MLHHYCSRNVDVLSSHAEWETLRKMQTVYCVTHGHYSMLMQYSNSTGVNIIWFIRQWMLCKQLFSLEKHVGHCTGGRNELRYDSLS